MVTQILHKMNELHIEASSNCQAKCVMCPRTGLDGLIVTDLTLDWFKENIKPQDHTKIFFCGILGDPCINKDLNKICRWIKDENPEITLGINTNGALQNTAWWEDIASIFTGIYDYVVFSIDGTEKTNHIYREDVSWRKVMENAKAYINAGGSAHWDMLVFKHNASEIDECRKLAKNLGFNWFRSKETIRWDIFPEGINQLFPVDDSWKDQEPVDISCESDYSKYYDAQGNKWPCCHMAEAYLLAGNEDIKKFSNTQLLDNYNERLLNDPYDICKKACGTTSRKGQWRQEINLTEEK